MSTDIGYLYGLAVAVAFLHTVTGPDHYVPFVAMSRAGGWSLRRTVLVTTFCGVGHVLGSVVLGFVGIALGVAVFKLEDIEAVRGGIAGWLLLAFGLVYMIWGFRQAVRSRPHVHLHVHADGTMHTHGHTHRGVHLHVHHPETAAAGKPVSLAPWVLFTIFLFGPCEPLIPILMYPAAAGRIWDVVLVTLLFGTVTIGTMTGIVIAVHLAASGVQKGVSHYWHDKLGRLGRFGHAIAGCLIFACGAAIKAGL